MSKSVPLLLLLTLSGLRAAPIAPLRGLPKPSSPFGLSDDSQQNDILGHIPDGFHQGTEPSKGFVDNGLVQDHINEMTRKTALAHNLIEEKSGLVERKHWLADEVPIDVPAQRNGGGWVRVEEPSSSHLPEGFRQGTEPFMSIPDGFRQGSEPVASIPKGFRQGTEPTIPISGDFKLEAKPSAFIPDGFRQGTEPFLTIPDGFRQGTEPFLTIPDGFRQGTERSMIMPDGFRQGTEPFLTIPDGFRQGTEPSMRIPDGFRQGSEPSDSIISGLGWEAEALASNLGTFRQGTEPTNYIPSGFRQGTEPSLHMPEDFRQGTGPLVQTPKGQDRSTSWLPTQTCQGEVINGKCYEFNPTPLGFTEAQDLCKAHNPHAELASITSGDLHSRLVSLVTNSGERSPQLTWLGATVKNQQASWLDGSEMNYSDWMPGHPNIHTDKPVCVEMFKIDESWWTAADCDLKRASICSYQIAA